MKFIFSIFIILSSYAHAQSVDQDVSTLETQLKSVEAVIDQTPYKEEQHLIIEAYFKKLNNFALNVKDYSNTSKAFNNFVAKYGTEAFCKKVFLESQRMIDLLGNCTKNGFFICAEEARALTPIKTSLKDSLRPDLKKSFENTKACVENQ